VMGYSVKRLGVPSMCDKLIYVCANSSH